MKGYVAFVTGEPTPGRGGRAKRFFRIKADGRRALRRSQDAISKMMEGLETQWGNALEAEAVSLEEVEE